MSLDMVKILKSFFLISALLIGFAFNIYGMQSASADKDSLQQLSVSKLANEFYEKGEAEYKSGNFELAAEFLQKAIDIDDKFAKAYDLLTLVYIDLESVHTRTLAERTIRKAIEIDSKNTLYKLHYGKLMLRQGFRYNARKRFEWLKTIDSTNTELYLNLGLLYMNEMEYYKNMVSGSFSDGSIVSFIDENMLGYIFNYEGTGPVKEYLSERNESIGKYTDFSAFVQKDYANAVIAFSEALELEPDNRDALHNLSLLSLEGGMIDRFIDYQKKILKNNPDDKDTHLFLGFGHYILSDHEISHSEYEKAKSLMESDERAVFESIEYIIPADEVKKYNALASADKSKFKEEFWKPKDPLFLSEYNERILEHYSRIPYANLKFGVKKNKIAGWETDRGKIYIRYGPPNEIARLRAEKAGIGGGRDLDLTEIWYYDGFSFAFEDLYLTGDFRLGARSRFPNIHFPEIAEQIYKEKPDIYIPSFKGDKFDFGYSLVSFRGDNGKSLIEVYHAVPINALTPKREKDYMVATLNGGIFFFDEKWYEVNKKVSKEKINLSLNLKSEMNYYIIGQNQLEIDPGEYNFAIEFQEEVSKNTGTYRDIIYIDSYPFGEFKVSDILLASNILPGDEDSKYTKNGLKIIPNPARLFYKNQLMHIYFEIYNLMINPEQKTKFLVEYKVSAESEDKKPIMSKIISNLGKLVGVKEGRQDITASYEYEGVNPTENINLSIDMSATKFGIYELSITITDLNSNNLTSKSIKFGIQNAPINYLF